jgi:ubiquinone/menaquinone biosynthesis C-methylase UbiE
MDDTARRYLEVFREEAAAGCPWANNPWLDLDVEGHRAYARGERSALPGPVYTDGPVVSLMMEGVGGKHVLCLAGGGGQQSAVFALLGAKVTVFDLAPEQLEADQRAADHYGYAVDTIQGDMRDLSALPRAEFDRVYQPISTLFIPDLRQLYHGVARVIKPGGLYHSQYAAPLLYMAEQKPWDGEAYTLRITQPYIRGAVLETEDGRLNCSQGRSFAEFHHLLSDIINGHIAEGFEIRGVWEDPRPDSLPPLQELEPGSDEHRKRFIPFGLSIVARSSRIGSPEVAVSREGVVGKS